MKKLIACAFNMVSSCVELKFRKFGTSNTELRKIYEEITQR